MLPSQHLNMRFSVSGGATLPVVFLDVVSVSLGGAMDVGVREVPFRAIRARCIRRKRTARGRKRMLVRAPGKPRGMRVCRWSNIISSPVSRK